MAAEIDLLKAELGEVEGPRSAAPFRVEPKEPMTRETRRSPSQQSKAFASDQERPHRGGEAADPGSPDRMRRRWTPLKKLRVLLAVQSGALAERDLWEKLRISETEFNSWRRAFAEFGYAGLKTTQLQKLRRRGARRK